MMHKGGVLRTIGFLHYVKEFLVDRKIGDLIVHFVKNLYANLMEWQSCQVREMLCY